jgi:hypothetical protein
MRNGSGVVAWVSPKAPSGIRTRLNVERKESGA